MSSKLFLQWKESNKKNIYNRNFDAKFYLKEEEQQKIYEGGRNKTKLFLLSNSIDIDREIFFINEEKNVEVTNRVCWYTKKIILVLPQLKNYIYVCKQSPVLYINWLNTN